MFYLTGILTIVFVVLKLCAVIAWSWWLVLLPIILWFGLIGLLFLIPLAIALLIGALKFFD